MIVQILQGRLILAFVIDNNYVIAHWNIARGQLTDLAASKIIGTKKQWLAFYKVEKPITTDLIVGRAPREVLSRHFVDRAFNLPWFPYLSL